MTLLLREVVGFLLGAGLWALALSAVAAVTAAAILSPAVGRPDPRHLGVAIVSGAAAAALVHRIGTGLLWVPRVGGRELPVVWVVVGAAVAALVVLANRRTAP